MHNVDYIIESSARGNIVIRVFREEITKQDIVESFNHMINTKMLNADCIGLINDISDSILMLDMGDLEKMVSFISNNKILSGIKIAVVGNSPNKILFPTLANFKLGDMLLPFSNIEVAKEWIIEL